MNYFESLPQSCPDADAMSYEGIVYRLVSASPCDADFLSQRELSPEKKFNATECIARSLSVFDNKEEARKISLLPLHANKKIAEVELIHKAGVIKKTGKSAHHFSWWRARDFAVLGAIKGASK